MKQTLMQHLNNLLCHRWLLLTCLIGLGFTAGKIVGSTDNPDYCPVAGHTCKPATFC
ncbi:hypothetical protein D3C81_188020 [compost metagenome]